jgi:pimeloyl-ACP methyl ester carboxylesterase
MTGEADPTYETSRDRVAALPELVPNLAGTIILPGGGHWIGEEKPREVNDALLDVLRTLSRFDAA